MKKLRAIWQILFADKWAIFIFNEVPDNPEYTTAPYFKWNVSAKDCYFFQLIRNKLNDIENNQKT